MVANSVTLAFFDPKSEGRREREERLNGKFVPPKVARIVDSKVEKPWGEEDLAKENEVETAA